VVQEGRGCWTAPADGGAENGSGGRHVCFRSVEGEERLEQMGQMPFVSRQAWACLLNLCKFICSPHKIFSSKNEDAPPTNFDKETGK
jgi:hypothetical protein